MNLNQLNRAEKELLSRVRTIDELIEEKDEQFEATGIFEDYRRIFEQYVLLITDDIDGLEALKRAVFLLWFEVAQPSFLSGIRGFSQESGNQAFACLEQYFAAGKVDHELKWMLQHYYVIAEWVFDVRHRTSTELKRMVADHQELFLTEAKPEHFVGRGQMGDYWASVATSNAARLRWEK